MKKIEYIAPESMVIKLNTKVPLLAESDGTGGPGEGGSVEPGSGIVPD